MKLKKVAKYSLYFVFLMGLIVGFLESVYRFQVIDFYKPELTSYNRPQDLVPEKNAKKTVLILGDSFSAGLEGNYPTFLRQALPQYRIVNSAVSGTGSIQARLIAANRFAQFDPDVFIYQIYIGNDLFNIRYPTNYTLTSLARFVYWNMANHLRFIAWLNYRLGQISALREGLGWLRGITPAPARPSSAKDVKGETFCTRRYTTRELITIRADPTLVDDTINLKPRRRRDFTILVENVRNMLALCVPGNCQSYVVVIPHKVQVNEEYLKECQTLGLRFADEATLQTVDYPFIRQLSESLSEVENVEVINPVARAQALVAEGIRLYKVNDGHMNVAGQVLLYQMILERLAILDGLG